MFKLVLAYLIFLLNMNIRSLLVAILGFFLFSTYASSQNWESIKENNTYLFGEGWGASIAEADKQALADLISKISVHISNETTNRDESNITNGVLNESSQFSQSVNTYSQATLTNTERIIIQNEPDAHVGRWIKRSEIEKIFDARKAKAIDLVETALRAEEKGKADDALRNYYWALTLLKSLQRPNDVIYTDDSGKSHVLTNWIKEKMEDVFDDLKATVGRRNGDDVELFITYKGKPVNSVDYTYFDGRGWSNIYSAKDGVGVLELAAGNVSTQYQLKYEYEYRGEAQIDKELESVLNVVKGTPMRKAYCNIKQSTGNQQVNASKQSFTSTDKSILSSPKALGNEGAAYAVLLNRIIKSIEAKNYGEVKSLFTPEGWSMYNKLITYGSAKIVGIPNITFFQTGDEVMARGLQMSFSFKNGVRKAFVEDVVFIFDKNKNVTNVAFGLGKTAEDDILNKGVWNETTRTAIMNFLENYKTAYALKRLDYIQSVFDDDAVIITGQVIKKQNIGKEIMPQISNQIIKYNRQKKEQYIENLTKCFERNEFINIRFADNNVIKMGQGGELYAIQISQDYYSSTYGDKGYLFIMVDINDPKKPLIKVRTWQPEKDPKFGLYGPGDF